jgi:hypothetical protein
LAKWEQHRHTKCKVCEKECTDENNKLLGCAYCEHRTHDKCDTRQLNSGRKEWNTYQCIGCVETFKHPTVREEERVRNIAQAMETLDDYNKLHDNHCCRCQKTVEETDNGDESKYILSCASCMKSAHEHGCATQEETVIGQYWQCNECRSRRYDIHSAYKILATNKFDTIHRKRMSQMTTMAHWRIKGHTEKQTEREFDRQTHTPEDWKDDTTSKQINNRGIRPHIKN